jgi:hypothetical protein
MIIINKIESINTNYKKIIDQFEKLQLNFIG